MSTIRTATQVIEGRSKPSWPRKRGSTAEAASDSFTQPRVRGPPLSHKIHRPRRQNPPNPTASLPPRLRSQNPSPGDAFRSGALSGGIARSYHRLPRSGISATRRPLPDFYTCHLPQAASRRIAWSTGYITNKPASTTRRIRVVVDRR